MIFLHVFRLNVYVNEALNSRLVTSIGVFAHVSGKMGQNGWKLSLEVDLEERLSNGFPSP